MSHVGTSTTSVKRMLDGCQPHWPVPRLVAKVLSRQLHREISITDCGFVDHSPYSDDQYDGLRCSGTLDDTVRTIVELSGRDMNRRKFLLGASFAAGAFSEPALFALTVPPAWNTARVGGGRVGMADVEIITEHIAHLRRLDQRYGSGRVRTQVVQLLHREANRVMHGTYSERTGRALLRAVTETARLSGSMAADVGRHSLAQRYYIQTLDLAMSTDDRPYAAHVLNDMSRLTLHIGLHYTDDADRSRAVRQATALVRAGLQVAAGAGSPLLRALLHATQARAHSLLGDAIATRTAVMTAERHREQARPGEEPAWLAFYSDAGFAADLGRCLRDAGEVKEAVRLTRQALDGYEPWRVRNRCFAQIDLTAAHLAAGDLEQAASAGRDALRTAVRVDSTHTRDRLRTLQRQTQLLRTSSPDLDELDNRITDLLHRNRARHDKNTAL